mmetsp:Transcript_12388/g.21906  ORF Transcript_12388/g.21906 Transcript_12388/m.21906 type:complete len:338 (+) Transcript_12388:255-1268(+)
MTKCTFARNCLLWHVIIVAHTHAGQLTNILHTHDQHCPRFATQPINCDAGIGHRYANAVFGIIMSMKMNATYMFDTTSFECASKNHKVGYRRIIDLLGFRAFSNYSHVNVSMFLRKEMHHVDLMAKIPSHDGCNTIHSFCETCCSGGGFPNQGYCFERSIGAFNYVKIFMQQLKRNAPEFHPIYRLFPVRASRTKYPLIVSIHLRLGDIHLIPGASFFSEAFNLIRRVSAEMNLFVFFEATHLPSGYEALLNLYPRLINNMSVEDTIYHWCESDVLISTGSSLPGVAFTSCDIPVMMSHMPKEGVKGYLDIEGVIWLDHSGLMQPESLSINMEANLM